MAELEVLTLEELKAQMRVDFEEDDNIITAYGRAAEEAVESYCRRSISELIAENEARGRTGFPYTVKVCMLMLASHLYRRREPVESVSQTAVPYTFEFMLKDWVKLSS